VILVGIEGIEPLSPKAKKWKPPDTSPPRLMRLTGRPIFFSPRRSLWSRNRKKEDGGSGSGATIEGSCFGSAAESGKTRATAEWFKKLGLLNLATETVRRRENESNL
jgi:hypothetical protein